MVVQKGTTVISSSNPFALLGSNKAKSLEQRTTKSTKEKRVGKVEDVEEKAAEVKPVIPKKKDEIVAKKESKVISLTEVQKKEEDKKELVKELKKEEKIEAKAEKQEKALTDRHDRSGKGARVRKEGKGVGGWEDNEDLADVAEVSKVEEPVVSKKQQKQQAAAAELSEEEKKKAEEEQKLKDAEDKMKTYEEYVKEQKSTHVGGEFNVRTVAPDQFKNMTKKSKTEEKMIIVKVQPPVVKAKPKPAVTPVAAPKSTEPKVKAEAKVKAEPKAKPVKLELNFKMENPAIRQARGRGGRGDFGGRGMGRGGRGRGEGHVKQEVDIHVNDDKSFPALGGK